MSESNDNYRRAYNAAVNILALREHSTFELARKVRQRIELSDAQWDALLLDLQHSGYVSDERFAQACVRSLINRQQGPVKIRHTLREKGIPDDAAKAAMAWVQDDMGVDWVELAANLRARKFGDELPTDFKERARQSRFLAGRGFYLDSINAVFHEKC